MSVTRRDFLTRFFSANARLDERLRMLYGDDYHLQIESEPGNGTRVVFKIPINEDYKEHRE